VTLNDIIKQALGVGSAEGGKGFSYLADSDGVNFVVEQKAFEACKLGRAKRLLLLQYVYLRQLEEQGFAHQIANGFSVPSAHAVALEQDGNRLMSLPDTFRGSFKLKVNGQTSQTAFSVELLPEGKAGNPRPNYIIQGPFLAFGQQEKYLMSPAELLAFSALDEHRSDVQASDTEHRNLKLVALLQHAKTLGMPINLSHFNQLEVFIPQAVSVTAVEQSDGSLLLIPAFGNGADPVMVNRRLGQLKDNTSKGTLRVGDQIIVLDETRFEATSEILSNQTIPRKQVAQFLESPGAFLDAALVDLEIGFSLRVKGAARFTYMQLGETDTGGLDWFSEHPVAVGPDCLSRLVRIEEELDIFQIAFEKAVEEGSQEVKFGGERIDISDTERVKAVIEKTRDDIQNPNSVHHNGKEEKGNVEERVAVDIEQQQQSSDSLLEQANRADHTASIDFRKYARQPFPHQEDGVRWLLGLVDESTKSNPNEGIQGGLLADDMGLGKTYMTLVSIAELYDTAKSKKKICKPILVVAPLSLLENWEDECSKSFIQAPFNDTVVLQSGRDLKKYRNKGAKAETRQHIGDADLLTENAIRYSLKVGREHGPDRLDLPARLVLTTYQTLRDYQFSLCRIDWGMVVFDEAQNIKNPNALQTRAAKGLKADFKLLTTGTPVENNLSEFWCLIDTVQPGLLGSWEQFRDTYVRPIVTSENESEARLEVGKRLRESVGAFMLRRMKEGNLKGLPKKHIFTGVKESSQSGIVYDKSLASVMAGKQRTKYEEVVQGFHNARSVGEGQGQALAALLALRRISLHPDMDDERSLISSNRKEARRHIEASGKLRSTILQLDKIRKAKEKVIVFAMTKKLQRLLKIWLEAIYAVPVEIINGDTKAVTVNKDSETRRTIIEAFEKRKGFGILIMSPIAAGVGLTIIGANNVIHLERHWNPAKEAQATDRVYRIGQTKDVNIYLPALHHPEFTSFDVNLDQLLARKTDLQDAVVTPQGVQAEDMRSVWGE
jgi:SNF2 family DNA or RNA helicase